MPNRPAIAIEIQREVLFESRHRCAVCCEPTPLERAHVRPWSKSHDHSVANLIALCANCHERADTEKWGEAYLKRYKKQPCAIAANAMPPMLPEQKAMVDLIIGVSPDAMTDHQRLRLASMVAAYAGVQFTSVSVVSVSAANSARVRIELPHEAADALLKGLRAGDPLIKAYFEDIPVIRGERVASAARTDMSEKGLESLIVSDLVTGGWLAGDPKDYDREYAVDVKQLAAFLAATQPEIAEAADLANAGPVRQKFLARLQGEISKRGVIDLIRSGFKHGPHHINVFYGTPSPGNVKAAERYAQNRFSVTRQLRYSRDETTLALDMALFINGLPVATFELKNSVTKQTVQDAIEQYQRDRDPRERIFEFGRCIVHLAVDDHEVRFCTELKGKASWFLPFNQGYKDGAGNPPSPYGIKTDYLWKRFLTPRALTEIIENYAQIVETRNEKTGKKKYVQIFPRYHQLDVVRKLLADARLHGAGKQYLIQHSAGSGKSNSIAWLSHQLIGLKRNDKTIFDSIIVVTDRRILDQQIRDTIKQFAQVSATVGHAEHSGDLRRFIEEGKKIIITTVQKFPFIIDEIGSEHRGRMFAIVIDEAHSSQGGKASAALSMALAEGGEAQEEETPEDRIKPRIPRPAFGVEQFLAFFLRQALFCRRLLPFRFGFLGGRSPVGQRRFHSHPDGGKIFIQRFAERIVQSRPDLLIAGSEAQALDGFARELAAQAQRALDPHLPVAECRVRKPLGIRPVLKLQKCVANQGDMLVREFAVLLAEILRQRLEPFGRVDELHLALPVLGLPVGQHPDIGCNAGVVEHVHRQRDDGLQPVILDNPATDIALALAGVSGEQAGAVMDLGDTAAEPGSALSD